MALLALTGPLVRWGTAGLAVLAAGALVAAWPRLAGRGPLAVLGRSAALAAVNALVVLALLVTANDVYGFYSGYQDLLGHQGATRVLHGGALSTGDPAGPAAGAPRDPGVPVPGTGGRVQRLVVDGASGTSGAALVLLPSGYADPASATRRYPVLEAFHGYPGAPDQWLGAMGLQHALDAAVAAHRIAPTLVVIPDLTDPPGRDTECVNGPSGQPQMESWLTSDVPRAVEAAYRVRSGPGSWATAGLSMGGWCAAMAAVLHPQQYGAALVFGGYFRYDPGAWRAFRRGAAAILEHDLVDVARTAPPPVAVWVTTSRTDRLSYPSTAAFVAAARPPLAVTAVVLSRGGHRTDVWTPLLGRALAWLGSTEPGFAASA
jgi:Putative esterase